MEWWRFLICVATFVWFVEKVCKTVLIVVLKDFAILQKQQQQNKPPTVVVPGVDARQVGGGLYD